MKQCNARTRYVLSTWVFHKNARTSREFPFYKGHVNEIKCTNFPMAVYFSFVLKLSLMFRKLDVPSTKQKLNFAQSKDIRRP